MCDCVCSEVGEDPAQSAVALEALERQKLLAEVAERKRKILRDVEVSGFQRIWAYYWMK